MEPVDRTPTRDELINSANQWRTCAENATPEFLKLTCIGAAVTLEMQAEDGVARRVFSLKPFGKQEQLF